jgi:hypothetical protein
VSVALRIEVRFDDGGRLALSPRQVDHLVGRLVRNPDYFGSLSLAAKLRGASRDGVDHVVCVSPCEAAAVRHAGGLQ